jgi:hypothetical protein
MRITADNTTFPAYFITARSNPEKREMVARIGLSWLLLQHKRGARGCLMIDIDDTIIDRNDNVVHGFEHMRHLYNECNTLFPIHVVTARPSDYHVNVLKLLNKKGFPLHVDRLHMLPTEQYGKGDRPIIEFKWKVFLHICALHDGCVARFGDRLWDVAHKQSLNTTLVHVTHDQCYIFLDPELRGTASFKLPG